MSTYCFQQSLSGFCQQKGMRVTVSHASKCISQLQGSLRSIIRPVDIFKVGKAN